MNKRFLYFFMVFVAFSCQNSKEENNSWRLIYKNDNQGNPIFGDKKNLLHAVRSGYPVRIGFGAQSRVDSLTTIEHITNAGFLTILNNEDIYGQISQIIGQNPLLEKDTTNIRFRERTRWSIIVGSNGFSDRLTTSYNNDTILGKNQRNMWVSWFVKYPEKTKISSIPLWKK